MGDGHWAAGGGGSGRRDQGSGNPAVGGAGTSQAPPSAARRAWCGGRAEFGLMSSLVLAEKVGRT